MEATQAILYELNLRKSDVMVNSTGSNNETDLSLKCPEDGKHQSGTAAHQLADDECDIIGTLIGDYGRWQFLMTLLLALFQVPNTFHIYSPTFQAADKVYWCKRPERFSNYSIAEWIKYSNSSSNCSMYDLNYDHLVDEQQRLQSGMISCTDWEFKEDDLGNTWTSQWKLVCDKEWLKNVAEMFFLVGVASGGIVSGVLSDKFGRKRLLFISAVLQTFFGLALYFADSFELYLCLRALLGLVSVSVTYAGLILAMEFVDGKWQTIAGMYNLFPLPVSYIMISGIAYLTQDYQYLQLCIGLPGVFLCLLWFVIPESPRWLLIKGKTAEVKKIVKQAAAMNKRELPEDLDMLLQPPVVEESNAEVSELFKSKYLRLITFCFLCIWFTMNLVYYGLVLNMNALGGNIYLNSTLAGLVELPAIALAMYIIGKTGKKWLFCGTLMTAGLACLGAAIMEGNDEMLSVKLTFVMIGKFTISAGNTIMPVYTAELYPTAIRNIGVGACNVSAGFALILTPYLSMLTRIQVYLFMAILTAWCWFGAIVVMFLPENRIIPATDLDRRR
ncbi:organic cation transporter protein-like [Culicoides brevitarsis]|uniref:organic cation transporter protein-like n=1 Tax=Culicoides brevitarsis TaxID=469753 RepID=UPI00307BBB37